MLVDRDHGGAALVQPMGGSFSIWEMILRKGIGSPRLVYLNGHADLDLVSARSEDTSYCNIHLYKQGLVLRLHKKNKVVALGIRTNELDHVHFRTLPIRVINRGGIEIRKKAEIELHCGEVVIHLMALAPYYGASRNFFLRNFNGKIEESTAPVEDAFI